MCLCTWKNDDSLLYLGKVNLLIHIHQELFLLHIEVPNHMKNFVKDENVRKRFLQVAYSCSVVPVKHESCKYSVIKT